MSIQGSWKGGPDGIFINKFTSSVSGQVVCWQIEDIPCTVSNPDDPEEQYVYLLTSGVIKPQDLMLSTDVRVVVQEWTSEGSSAEEGWDLVLTEAEKLTNILLGNVS